MSNMFVNADSDKMVLALQAAPIDPRTGNKVIYGATWEATNDSMIGVRNSDWVRRELEWFMTGSNSLSTMEAPVPKAFQDCAGEDNTVNSAYGHILFHKDILGDGTSIYSRAVNILLEEGLSTRHSVAVITDRDIHRIATENGKNDFICTNALNLMVDQENNLHIFAQMRSMDAVWGYRADYSMWNLLMSKVVSHLESRGVKVNKGKIVFQVANLHVYPRHHKLLQQEADDISETIMRRTWKGQ